MLLTHWGRKQERKKKNKEKKKYIRKGEDWEVKKRMTRQTFSTYDEMYVHYICIFYNDLKRMKIKTSPG